MAMLSVLAASTVLGLASAVIPGPEQGGKGVWGGKMCGHAIYTRNDNNYGVYTKACTRFIICDGADDCHLAKVDDVQACAEIAAKRPECETDTGKGFIEVRAYLQNKGLISHCFCNTKGTTWVPDLSHKWSSTYELLMDQNPTTTAAPTTTEPAVVVDVESLKKKVAQIDTSTRAFMAASEKEVGAVEESILALESADQGLKQQLKTATETATALQGKLDAQATKFEGLLAAMQTKFEASMADEAKARKAVEDKLADTAKTLEAFTGPLKASDDASAKGCSSGTCIPEIEADGSDVTITALAGAVFFESEECAQTDLCALARDVAAVKSKFGQ